MHEKDLGAACGLIARLRQRHNFMPRSDVLKIEACLEEMGVALEDRPSASFWKKDTTSEPA